MKRTTKSSKSYLNTNETVEQIRCVWSSGTETYTASPPERYTDTCAGRYFFVENDIVKNYQFVYCPYCALPIFQREIPLYASPLGGNADG